MTSTIRFVLGVILVGRRQFDKMNVLFVYRFIRYCILDCGYITVTLRCIHTYDTIGL